METCIHCKYYFITWDSKRPHGCKAMGFKSREVPCVVVRKSSQGLDCLQFKRKDDKSK
ncbi:MAG: uracil-DNA glycosylase [Desulfobacteraceae bacterium]|nr:uracil-DNA glycosylase [Desulfobacteraceae bacterium]